MSDIGVKLSMPNTKIRTSPIEKLRSRSSAGCRNGRSAVTLCTTNA